MTLSEILAIGWGRGNGGRKMVYMDDGDCPVVRPILCKTDGCVCGVLIIICSDLYPK